MINISVTYGRNSAYKITQIPPSSGNAGEEPLEGGKVLCSIPPKSGVGYFHSFCLTDNYIVLTEQPLMMDIWKVLGHRFSASSFEQWLYWDATRWSGFTLSTGKMATVWVSSQPNHSSCSTTSTRLKEMTKFFLMAAVTMTTRL